MQSCQRCHCSAVVSWLVLACEAQLGYCLALPEGTAGWDSAFASCVHMQRWRSPIHPAPHLFTPGKEDFPSCGVRQHSLLTQAANNPAVDGVGRVAAVADRNGRVAEKMLSKLHTTRSGKRGDGISLFLNSAARGMMDPAGFKDTAL